MKRAALLAVLLALTLSVAAPAASIHGYVYLFPVESWFRSVGEAEYLNDLNQPATAVLSGEHRVTQTNGNVSYDTPVTGDGRYFYFLEGPAEPGNCFSTMLHAIADPPGFFNTKEETWNGPEIRCAPISSGGGCTGCACNFSLCEQSEFCPLILDLNNDGIRTTGMADPVRYWFDLQGRSELTAWTNAATEEAFLWMDLNHDHVAQPVELFGSRMIAPSGAYHRHGFEALAKYDSAEFGGDGDGRITSKDRVWSRLKLWVDRNHDAISQPAEISIPASHAIVGLNVQPFDGDVYDENGNELYLVSSYVVRTHGNETAQRLMADVEFGFVAND